MSKAQDVTALLVAWGDGEEGARNLLIEAVYTDLRRRARACLRRERAGHPLSPTALVHEAYLKLVDQHRVRWRNREHFLAVASNAMRRILVDHARAELAAKRGARMQVSLQDGLPSKDPPHVDILALDLALDKLASIEARQSQLVELRFFAGLTVEEAASVLGLAPATVHRDWAFARAWLYRELRGDSE
jgi:RNA polymerase sigma factor (TIGR02999 family)